MTSNQINICKAGKLYNILLHDLQMKHSWRIAIVLFLCKNTASITSLMFGLALLSRKFVPTWLSCWKRTLKRSTTPYAWRPALATYFFHWEIFWWDCKLCQGKGIHVHGLHAPLPPHILPLSCVLSLWRIAPGHWCWGCGCCYYEHTTLLWVTYLENELRRWRYTWKQFVYNSEISWNGITITFLVYPAHLSLPTSTMAFRKLWRPRKVRFWICRYAKGRGLDGQGIFWNY